MGPVTLNPTSTSDSCSAAQPAANVGVEGSENAKTDPVVTTRSLANELKVIAAVLSVVLLAELGLRSVEDSVSADIRHLKSLPFASQGMVEASPNGELKVLFLGNSITGASINAEVIGKHFRDHADVACSVTKVVPDNTRLADWTIAFDEFFLRNKQLPDVVVLGFRETDLRDEPPRHPDRIGRYYCDLADWARLAKDDLPEFSSHVEFLAGNQSVLFANRKRLRTGLLSRLIPGFVEASRAVNRGTLASSETASPTSKKANRKPIRYERLLEFHRLLAAHNVKLVLLAVPTPTQRQLEAELVAAVDSAEIALLDLRGTLGLSSDMFPDGLHMGQTASAMFSEALATNLAKFPEVHDHRPAQLRDAPGIRAIAIRPESNRQ